MRLQTDFVADMLRTVELFAWPRPDDEVWNDAVEVSRVVARF
jgi:hypothetical protein